jgi:hypothetical protein
LVGSWKAVALIRECHIRIAAILSIAKYTPVCNVVWQTQHGGDKLIRQMIAASRSPR